MDEITDVTKDGFRRVELLTGPGRRRRWSVEEKARIVAETLVPGVRVSDVARRWQVHPQQLFGWRQQSRKETGSRRPALTNDAGLSFVPIVAGSEPSAATVGDAASIAIELAGAVVRVTSRVDGEWLAAVLRAVRYSSGRT